MADFKGRIVHPQTWPEDLDYTGKRVVVIGSGATAATVIPAMAADCAHITMLQRSPTYFRIGRNAIDIADELRAAAGGRRRGSTRSCAARSSTSRPSSRSAASPSPRR